jgi:hypothetical protein
VWILPAGKPWLTVEWTRTIPEFEHDENSFATAIIHDENTHKSVSLYGRGLGCGFVLFFTFKDSPVVYFPSTAHDAIVMPCKFHLILYFQAKDLPLHRSKIYLVEADSWNRFRVSEIAERKPRGLRSIFSRRPSRQTEIPVIELGWRKQESRSDESAKTRKMVGIELFRGTSGCA